MIRILAAALLAPTLTIALPAPLLAQDIADLAARTQAAREAEEIARLMGEVQEAVVLAQAQYVGMVAGNAGPGYQGAIAYPGETPGVWHAVIVGRRGDGSDADWLALAEYVISQGQILSETLHPANAVPPLEGVASAMAQARYFAPRAVLAGGSAAFCLDEGSARQAVTFSTIVLPPRENGSFDAYVLNGPIEAGAIPLGRHYRVGFDAFGIDGAPELVTDTCEVVTWDAANPDSAPGTYVTQIEDGAVPTPAHVFISGLLPMDMRVVAGDAIWILADGIIASPVPAP